MLYPWTSFCSECLNDLREEQQGVLNAVLAKYPEATLVAQTERIRNAIFLSLPLTADDALVDGFIRNLPGVKSITPGEDYKASILSDDRIEETTFVNCFMHRARFWFATNV